MTLLLWGRRVYYLFFVGVFFQKIGQNGRPGGREAPQSISFDETSRMVSIRGRRQKISFAKKNENVPNIHRAQTDFIRLVSSKLMLWGASRRLGLPF